MPKVTLTRLFKAAGLFNILSASTLGSLPTSLTVFAILIARSTSGAPGNLRLFMPPVLNTESAIIAPNVGAPVLEFLPNNGLVG